MKTQLERDVRFRYYEGGLDRTFVLQQSHLVELARYSDIKPQNLSLAFYEFNYEAIAAHIQGISPKVRLGPMHNRCCRFCSRTETSGEATFRLEAHGFPRLIGNRTFFTNYECDECNSLFGNGIENQLGIYLKPYRTLAAIRGHKSFPAIKNEKEGWRIWRDRDGLHIHHESDKRIAELGEDGRTLTVSIPRGPYRPLDVYKAFTKMALSLITESEIGNFEKALCWIRGEATFQFFPPTVSTTFIEGPPVSAMSALLLRRRNSERELPYLMALFLIANTQFQLMVPCFEMDQHLRDKKMVFPSFPLHSELNNEQHRVHFEEVDLSEARIVKDEVVKYDFTFSERIETTPKF